MPNLRAKLSQCCCVLVVAGALGACAPTQKMVHVDAATVDSTLPTVLTLQATSPGRPSQIVMRQDVNPGGDISVEAHPGEVYTVVATAKDDESGIRVLEVAGLVTAYKLTAANTWYRVKDHVSDNFGASQVLPLALPSDYPVSARVEAKFDFTTLANEYDWVIINLVATADNGTSRNAPPDRTDVLTLYYKKPGSPPL